MGEWLLDLALPRSDRAALIQLLVAVPLFATWIVLARRNRDHLLFATGIATITLAWFALRTLH